MTDLLTAFGLIALAELGDKSQLLALAFAARYRWWQVLIGVAIAATGLLGVAALLGGAVGTALPDRAIALGAGVLFLGFAVWTVRGDDDHEDDAGPDGAVAHRGRWSVIVTISLAFLVAELGDKTMLGTAALASTRAPVAVWLGAAAGMTLVSGAAIVLGRLLHRRVPAARIRLLSAAAFGLFGVLLLVEGIRG